MKRLLRIIGRTVKWLFLAMSLFLISLFFREQHLPGAWLCGQLARWLPKNLVVNFDSMAIGFRHGVHLYHLRVYDTERANALEPLLSADVISIYPMQRRVRIEALKYAKLPDSYYAPDNLEKNSHLECTLPEVERFTLELIRPDILGVAPESVECDLELVPMRFSADRIRLKWPDQDVPMALAGFCYVDLEKELVYGEVDGLARQPHIRPLLERLDIPVSLPYFDGFTEVTEPVPSWCSWKVNLVNNDFDLGLKLHPRHCKYNGVAFSKVDGDLKLHVYTRGTNLNYRQTFGPIAATGIKGQPLAGTVLVSGTNGHNTVTVDAKSSLPAIELLKVGGFAGDYVDDTVTGEGECRLEFRFPRAMTNNYEVLNGEGHIAIHNGQVMRMKGFHGLIALLADKVPGVSWFTDSTEATCDYKIERGIVKVDNGYIEGSVFSIKMYGEFDAVKNRLNFTVRVQFMKNESTLGKILHPLTWPFTKLLLEFRLTGTPEDPKWEYVTVLDRVVDGYHALTGAKDK